MKFSLLQLNAFSWPTYVTGVATGLTVSIIASVFLWWRRMTKIEHSFVSLEAKLSVLNGNMDSKFSVLDSNMDGRMGKIETRLEVLPDKIGVQIKGIADSVDFLARESKVVHAELAKHFSDCEMTVIGPLKEQMGKVAAKVLV